MALLHQATLSPTKLEVLTEWVPSRPWTGDGDTTGLELLGAFRFDDPAGQVGIETHLLRTVDGRILQVPLTYRPEPRDGAEPIATMRHSVLGKRWIYDGVHDPVYVQALAEAILTGGTQAELQVQTDSGLELRDPAVTVQGSGAPGTSVPALEGRSCAVTGSTSIIDAGSLRLAVVHVLGTARPEGHTLVGRWAGQQDPELLAFVPDSPAR